MIKFNITKKNNEILIEVEGHSGYSESGSDIVCSAVSTAMYTTIGLLNKFQIKSSFVSDEKIPIMKLKVLQLNDLSTKIIDNLIEVVTGIANGYSKYIKIKEN